MAIENLRELAIVNGIVGEYTNIIKEIYFLYCDELPPSGVTHDDRELIVNILNKVSKAEGLRWGAFVVGKNLDINIIGLLNQTEEEVKKEHHEDADLSKIYVSMIATIDEFCRAGEED